MCINNKTFFFVSLTFQCEDLKDRIPTVKIGITLEDIELKSYMTINGPCCSTFLLHQFCLQPKANGEPGRKRHEESPRNMPRKI